MLIVTWTRIVSYRLIFHILRSLALTVRNSLNVSGNGTMSHKVKLYGIAKLGSGIIFLSVISVLSLPFPSFHSPSPFPLSYPSLPPASLIFFYPSLIHTPLPFSLAHTHSFLPLPFPFSLPLSFFPSSLRFLPRPLLGLKIQFNPLSPPP